MFKRTTGFILAGSLMLTALTGCGGTEKGKKDIGDVDISKPIEIEMMLLNNTSGDGSDFVAKKLIKDKFNVDIKFSLNNNQAHFEKLNLLIASNELPDIVSPIPADRAKLIGPKGALIPVDEYYEYLPNFEKYMKQDLINIVSSMANDSHIYNLPRFAPDKREYKWTPMIRQDYLNDVGLPVPKTYDELYDALRAIKAKYPNTVGIVNREKMDFIKAYGVGYNTSSGMFYNKDTDKFEFGPLNQGFKELITDFAGLWKEGLLEKEFFTASEQQWQEKFLSGNAVFTLDWAKRAYTLDESYQKLNPNDKKFNMELIMPLTSDNCTEPRLNYSETLGLWTSWGISANTKHLGRILQIVDYMYSDEAKHSMQWGIKDETYLEAGDGKFKWTPDLKASYNPDGKKDPMNDLGLNHNRLMRLEAENGVAEMPQDVVDMVEKYKKEVNGYENDYKIALTFTEEQSDQIEEIKMQLDTMVNENIVSLITGVRPISEFDTFVNEIKSNGGETLEKIYADAFAEYKNKMKELK